MVSELLIRFFVGGLIVSAFAVIGDSLRPKSFAGIFGAAPSVALSSLGLAFFTHDDFYVAAEGRFMLLGAVALGIYSLVVQQLLVRYDWHPIIATGFSWTFWLAAAFGLRAILVHGWLP